MAVSNISLACCHYIEEMKKKTIRSQLVIISVVLSEYGNEALPTSIAEALYISINFSLNGTSLMSNVTPEKLS
jgi:hypothetical protein